MARDDPRNRHDRISAGRGSGFPERLPARSYRPIGNHESWQWEIDARRQAGSRLPFSGSAQHADQYGRFRVGDHPTLLPGMDYSPAPAPLEDRRREGRREGRGEARGESWRRSLRDSLRAPARGSFRGRSPKNYRPSDERLREQVCERLTEDHDLDASDIEVDVADQEVTLSGSVDSRTAKFHAEELTDRTGGVREIHNRLRVLRFRGDGWRRH